jgi:hypothetical protein
MAIGKVVVIRRVGILDAPGFAISDGPGPAALGSHVGDAAGEDAAGVHPPKDLPG